MKTNYFSSRPLSLFSFAGMMAILVSSCGSYQNSSYDNDGIYGNGANRTDRPDNNQNNAANYYYKDYFGSLQGEEQQVEVFTDVDNYRSDNDSIESQRQYATGNAGWGNDSDIIVNVYDNNWGYGMWNNYWYSGWGWNVGWGWNNWYGPGWGMGWNNWYGPGWGWNSWYVPAYGYHHHHGHHWNDYAYNNGIRGTRNNMYGNSRTSSGRNYSTGRNVNSNYNNGTRSTRYSGTRNTNFNTRSNPSQSGTRTNSTTRSNNYNTQAPVRQSSSPTRNNTYSPTRSSPSSGGIRSGGSSGGGRSGGSSGGGRSSGGRR